MRDCKIITTRRMGEDGPLFYVSCDRHGTIGMWTTLRAAEIAAEDHLLNLRTGMCECRCANGCQCDQDQMTCEHSTSSKRCGKRAYYMQTLVMDDNTMRESPSCREHVIPYENSWMHRLHHIEVRTLHPAFVAHKNQRMLSALVDANKECSPRKGPRND